VASWTKATAPRTLPAELPRPATTTDGGALRPADGSGLPAIDRRLPSPRLADYVERFWFVRWDVPRPAERTVLAHPAVNLSIEQGSGRMHGHPLPAALVHGIVRHTFRVELRDRGWVLGAKFRPGGFTAAFGADPTRLVDRVEPLGLVVELPAADQVRDGVLAASTIDDKVAELERWFAERLPAAVDPDYMRLLDIVAAMLADRSLVRAESVADRFGMSMRSLQRVFRHWIGVGPKWMLARYRLHDAIAALDAETVSDLAGLASSLGWFDQAHFTREFTALVGVSPQAYLARPR